MSLDKYWNSLMVFLFLLQQKRPFRGQHRPFSLQASHVTDIRRAGSLTYTSYDQLRMESWMFDGKCNLCSSCTSSL